MTAEHHVRRGQIWADNDARNVGRTLRVLDVVMHSFTTGGLEGLVPYAACEVLRPPDSYPQGRVGKQVTIRVSRMRPTSTGYRLVQDAPTEVTEP